MTMNAPQDVPGHTPEPHSSLPSEVSAAPAGTPARIPAFTPRRGRVAVALVGVLSLGAALITFVLGVLDPFVVDVLKS